MPYRTGEGGTYWRDDPDQSFPEPEQWNGDDNKRMPSQGRSRKGPVHQQIRQRDEQELLSALLRFRATHGNEALQRVLDESKG